MGVDCDPVSGYGIYIDEKWVEKRFAEKFNPEWEEDLLDEGWNLASLTEQYDYDFGKNIFLERYGSNYRDNGVKFVLFATDPINNMDGFLEDLKKLGIIKAKKDIEFIQEVIWC